MLKKLLIISGLVAFFALDEVLLVVLFFRIGFPHFSVVVWVLIGIVLILLNVSLGIVAYRALMRRPTTGIEGLTGATGVVISSQGRKGKVMVRGEHWDGEFTEDLKPGDEIRVIRMKGLTLVIEKDDNAVARTPHE